MEYMHAVTQRGTASSVSAVDSEELTIQDVLNGRATFDEYHSSKDEHLSPEER
ncbi:hypothetical protein [Lentzea jiangxiensis]|uniref:Uncharacterized protein n=1 Tax=Lentzea jiangxiensis TaxID=641025 RepID=A0A1H0SJA5_9PSEU|nr:hypothetical protein [Lentzea jiangxiensis]SDP41807.1 hypothetical protein SAMN05421507_108102 [Lentzea jiangxiensis]